eukprot:GHVS01007556.1.p1 GENE.GHVS01007556.1~~GHVS01007556.1.p1  ORF type:complete len:299 (-),score=30.80 GHVS01007556.1:218-1114(-)
MFVSAMYLSVKCERSFFDRANWKHPYQGFGQAILHRSLSNGIYFPFETMFSGWFLRRGHGNDSQHEQRANPHLSCPQLVITGTLSGACCGFILHPLSVIKYRCWGFKSTPTFSSVLLQFYSAGQLHKSLARGLLSTVMRDIVFGGCFCLLRHRHDITSEHSKTDYRGSDTPSPPSFALTTVSCQHDPSFDAPVRPSWVDRGSQFAHNFVAAGAGVALASPLNFVRNVKLSQKVGQPVPSSISILKTLMSDCVRERQQLVARAGWVRHRLLIGVGTFRVAFGMAIGAQLYSICIQEDWS